MAVFIKNLYMPVLFLSLFGRAIMAGQRRTLPCGSLKHLYRIRSGVVAAIWNDRRDDPNARCWQLYAAISTDGGEHFLPAERLSRRQTCTNEPRNWETFALA